MTLLSDNLEVCFYNKKQLSIKDLSGDLDIGDAKWDFLFEFLLNNSKSFYFLGERLEYYAFELSQHIEYLTETHLKNEADSRRIFFKVKPGGMIVSRKRLSALWKFYEFPALIFFGGDITDRELLGFYNAKISYEAIASSGEKMYLIHKASEPDVLWINYSFDVPDFYSLIAANKL